MGERAHSLSGTYQPKPDARLSHLEWMTDPRDARPGDTIAWINSDGQVEEWTVEVVDDDFIICENQAVVAIDSLRLSNKMVVV